MAHNGSKLIISKRESRVISLHLVNERMEHVTISDEKAYYVGDVFIGKIIQIVSSIEAAFVSLPNDERGFLSLRDNEMVYVTKKACYCKPKEGDDIMVQVETLPSKGKKAKLTGKISISGKYVVCCKGKGSISASSKLSASKKEALIDMVKDNYPLKDEQIGVIIRTNADSLCLKNEIDCQFILSEICMLSQRYHSIIDEASYKEAGKIIYQSPKAYLSEIRNLNAQQVDRIITDDETLFKEISSFLDDWQSEDKYKLELYKDEKVPISVLYGIEHKLDIATNSVVWLKSGGFIVIEQTEAMTVIDVNTGKYSKKSESEKTFFNINTEAAEEIAYQLRLRNISGIIIVDFINMKLSENYENLLDILHKKLLHDSVHTEIIDVTKLGLVEITRKKTDKTLKEQIFG